MTHAQVVAVTTTYRPSFQMTLTTAVPVRGTASCSKQERRPGQTMLLLAGKAVGDTVTFKIDVPKTNVYKVSTVMRGWGGDDGIYTLQVDGGGASRPVDFYDIKQDEFGTAALTAGPHLLTFKVVGKNPRSRGYAAHLRLLDFRGQQFITEPSH